MTTAEERSALHPAEIAKRPATYAALLIAAACFLWLILKLNDAVVQQVTGMVTDTRAVRDGHAKTREDMVALRGDLKTMREELLGEGRAVRVQLSADIKAVSVEVQSLRGEMAKQNDLLRQLIEQAPKKK